MSAVDRFSDLISPLNDRRQKSATRDGLVIPRARLCTQLQSGGGPFLWGAGTSVPLVYVCVVGGGGGWHECITCLCVVVPCAGRALGSSPARPVPQPAGRAGPGLYIISRAGPGRAGPSLGLHTAGPGRAWA